MEEYKSIIDFPNYQISNFGNVKNIKTNKLLKPRLIKKTDIYNIYDVNLYNDTRKLGFHKKVHRLVAEAFIPNPENKECIDHIDRNPLNNNVNNLRWATTTENLLNCNIRRDNTSGHTGIIFNKKREVYQIFYHYQNKKIYGGSYETLEKAIENYNNPFK